MNLHETVRGFQQELSPSRLLYRDLVPQPSPTLTSNLPVYSCENPGGLRPGAQTVQLVTWCEWIRRPGQPSDWLVACEDLGLQGTMSSPFLVRKPPGLTCHSHTTLGLSSDYLAVLLSGDGKESFCGNEKSAASGGGGTHI